MPFYRVNGLWMHVKLAGKRSSHPAPCRALVDVQGKRDYCCGMSTALCDWPVEGGNGTCSAPLCPEHATEVGKDRHYCPRHLEMHRAREPELF